MKKTIFPTILILFVLILGLSMGDKNTIQTQKDVSDPNFLKNEIHSEVMEFIKDTGADPDTCYIPFSENNF